MASSNTIGKQTRSKKQESYENLTTAEYQALLADPEVEVVEVEDTGNELDIAGQDFTNKLTTSL